MLVWLIHIGETFWLDGVDRLWRYSILSSALKERGHSVVRWAPTFCHATKELRDLSDFDVTQNDVLIKFIHAGLYGKNTSMERLFFNFKFGYRYYEIAKKLVPPDLILTAMPSPETCFFSIKLGSIFNIPVVIDVRDHWPDVFLEKTKKPLLPIAKQIITPYLMANRYSFKRAKAIFGISSEQLEWGMSLSKRSKNRYDRVFPHGYLKKQLSAQDRVKFTDTVNGVLDNGRDKIFCMFGTLSNQFEFDTLLKAAKIIKGIDGNIQFIIGGNGEKFKQLKEDGARIGNIITPGLLSYPEMKIIMERSMAGIAPYKANTTASLPNKIIEYMSEGLPIITSLSGDTARLIKKHKIGLIYEPDNYLMLAKTIMNIVNNQSIRKSMGENCTRLFKETYSSEIVYSDMAKTIENIILADG